MALTLIEEPAGPPAGSSTSPPPARPPAPERSRLLDRLRLAVVCTAFAGLALLQAPGKVVADTKLDLVVDPVAFLGRALRLWEPEGFAGQVQDQAYGYLFPMGPFFALGHLAGLPAWIVQRLWWAALLSVAFLGVVVLARRLRIGTPNTALVAGLAYALAPRMITVLGASSVEVVPMALAPWVLVPLVGAAAARSPRRAAALSGLAVFCVGGVNAVATAAVLPLPVLWLLTRPGGPLRRRLAAWWVAAVALATAWWAVPLVILGSYSPPFLDYIENAGTTTRLTDVLTVLRGTSQWVASLATPTGPQLPAGWSLLRDTFPVAGTVVLAAAALMALTRRDLPHRAWLVLGLVAGVALVGLGHVATVDGVLADPLHTALDGVLAPLRNVHKFDPVLRLPMVLALSHLVAVLVRRGRGAARPRPAHPWWPGARRVAARAGLALVALALVTTASPALAGRLAPPAGFESIPAYWRQTADFLAASQHDGRALLVPGSSFGTYAWGSTGDEPLQPLASTDWEVRNAIPLTNEAHIRVLDAIEQRLARGEGSEGLTRYLARAGISHLVLRNDLDLTGAQSTRPALVRQALANSPGIHLVASFGPDFPGSPPLGSLVFDAGLDAPAAAVQVYAVADPAPQAWTTPLSDAVTVAGGPDAVLALEDRGLVTDRPTVLAGAGVDGTAMTVVSDALVRRERTFGQLSGASSGGLSADDPLRLDAPAADYPVPDQADAESVVRYSGAVPSASSSASDPDSAGGTRLDAQPWNAVDGDPATAWRPARGIAETDAQWRLRTDASFDGGPVTVTLGSVPGRDRPTRLRLTTDAGSLTVRVAGTDAPQTFRLPAGSSRRLAISSVGGQGAGLALAEVSLPGVSVTRSVVTPAPTAPADVYAFDAAQPGSSGCVVDGDVRCAAGLVRAGEETGGLDRVFTVMERAGYDLALTATPRPGPALDALIAGGGAPSVEASSSAVPDPRGDALAAVDGDPGTGWVAAADDDSPSLVLTWPEPRTIDSLTLVMDPSLRAGLATAVTIDAGGLPRTLTLDADHSVDFAPVTTDRLVVTFARSLPLYSYDPYGGGIAPLGIGVSELELGSEAWPAADPDAVVDVACGQGPEVTVDGVARQTSLRTTVGDLRALRPVDLQLCDGSTLVPVAPGEHRLTVGATDTFAGTSATLTRTGVGGAASGRAAADTPRWDAEHRQVDVAARAEPTLLVVPENINPGWRATLDGRPLDAVAVDGWQQGYVLPPGGAGTVTLDFVPGATYTAALAAGAGGVVVVVLLALVRPRRVRSWPVRRPGRGAAAFLVLAGLAGTAMVGGVAALAAVAVLGVVAAVGGRRGRVALGVVAAGALVVAGALLLAVPEPTATARQVLAVVAVAAVVASALPLPRRDR